MINSNVPKFTLLKNKIEVLLKFQQYKAIVKNQAKKKIKMLGCDNGGNLTSLISFVKTIVFGINLQHPIPLKKKEFVKEKSYINMSNLITLFHFLLPKSY
jgi:Na+/H+ antiporter NhaD/arsenite permease-like protein